MVDLNMDTDAELNFEVRSKTSSVRPIHVIATKGDIHALEIVLKNKNLDLNAENQSGVNAFWVACRFGHGEIMRRLAMSKIDVLTKDRNGVNCLHLAVQRDHGHIVTMLLASGFPLEEMTNEGYTAIHIAAKYGREEIMKQILTFLENNQLKKSSVMNKLCKKTNSPALSIAIENDFDEIATMLLENGAKIFFGDNAQTKNASPIFEAISHRKIDIIELMEQERFNLAGRIKTANG